MGLLASPALDLQRRVAPQMSIKEPSISSDVSLGIGRPEEFKTFFLQGCIKFGISPGGIYKLLGKIFKWGRRDGKRAGGR